MSERIIMNIKFCTEKDLENVVNMYGFSIQESGSRIEFFVFHESLQLSLILFKSTAK